jgi:hypothetical protein
VQSTRARAEGDGHAFRAFRRGGDGDWWNAAKHIAAGMDERKVLSGMRFSARQEFSQLVQPALQKYVQTHNSQFPTDLAQLHPYLKSPVDDAVLERWKIVPASEFPEILSQGSNGATQVVTQRASSPIEEAGDLRWLIQPNGLTFTDFKPIPKQ